MSLYNTIVHLQFVVNQGLVAVPMCIVPAHRTEQLPIGL